MLPSRLLLNRFPNLGGDNGPFDATLTYLRQTHHGLLSLPLPSPTLHNLRKASPMTPSQVISVISHLEKKVTANSDFCPPEDTWHVIMMGGGVVAGINWGELAQQPIAHRNWSLKPKGFSKQYPTNRIQPRLFLQIKFDWDAATSLHIGCICFRTVTLETQQPTNCK